jgi:tetratricopeptide (TPR) repeat protein
MYAGDIEGGIHHFELFLESARTTADRRSTYVALMNLGETEYRLKRYSKALEHLTESWQLARDTGEQVSVSVDATLLSLVESEMGAYAAAAQWSREAMTVALNIKAWPRLLYALISAAQLYLRLGQYQRAGELLGLATRHAATNADAQNTAKSVLEELGGHFAPDALETALTRGAMQDLETTAKRVIAELQAQ